MNTFPEIISLLSNQPLLTVEHAELMLERLSDMEKMLREPRVVPIETFEAMDDSFRRVALCGFVYMMMRSCNNAINDGSLSPKE